MNWDTYLRTHIEDIELTTLINEINRINEMKEKSDLAITISLINELNEINEMKKEGENKMEKSNKIDLYKLEAQEKILNIIGDLMANMILQGASNEEMSKIINFSKEIIDISKKALY